MTHTPTDALRLVPVKRIHFAIDAIAHLKPEKARFALEQMLAAAPASPLPGGGWQDISTAPKDGTVVDLFYPERGRLTDATWGPTGWGRHEWRGSHTVRMIPSEKPTHWMPLPTAPTGEPK